VTVPDPMSILVVVVFVASNIVASAVTVLHVNSFPWAQTLLITAFTNLPDTLRGSVLHWPGGEALRVTLLSSWQAA